MLVLNPKSHLWMRNSNLTKLFEAFPKDSLRFVGGCVRNSILGVDVGDVDLATTLIPEGVTKVLKSSGIKLFPRVSTTAQ